MAESVKVGHKVAGSTKSADGFNRSVERSESESPLEDTRLREALSGKFRLGSKPKMAIIAFRPFYAVSHTNGHEKA